MEGKRAAAATLCYCVLAMLSVSVSVSSQQQQQHQVAGGFAGFCGCFGDCSDGCREEGRPRWLCTVKCVEACAIDDSSHELPTAGGDCSTICLATNVCGAADTASDRSTAAEHAAACVDDCTASWNTYNKNKHA